MATANIEKHDTAALKRRRRVTVSRKGADSENVVLKLKLEHMIVFQALEDANRSNQRAVGVAEISQEVSTRDKKRLIRIYQNPLSSLIPKILTLLIARGLVFSPGISNRRRSYGSVRVLNPSDTSAPNFESRRLRVLSLVRSAVTHVGRAVRNLEILNHAVSHDLVQGINQIDLTHDILSLAETGELCVVGRIRGEGKGHNLYLPFDMDVDLYKPTWPLTWLDEVAQVVEKLWSERVEEASEKNVRPKPFTTGDVRARIKTSSFLTRREITNDPQIIVDAVNNLATTREPLLRKITRKGQKSLLWVPVQVGDEEIDLEDSYANDAERMGAAVQRAVRRLGRPVTVDDVQDETDADFALQPINSSSLFQALAYAARKTFDAHDGRGKRDRALRRIFPIGRAGANVYYDVADSLEARSFVEFRRIELSWSDSCPVQELDTLQNISLKSVSTGRARLLSQQLDILLTNVSDLLASSNLDSTTYREAEELKACIEETRAEIQNWVTNLDNSLPTPVMNNVPFWTALEFLEIIKPLYPLAENWSSGHKLIRLMYKRVRMIPNPDFQHRFSNDPIHAAEFFFDRTDALIYAAMRWGGPECSLQAMLAKRELGLLRDPRFVFPALSDPSFEIRLAAVSCLAFLGSPEGNAQLKNLIENDPDPGIRQSALWAYGFSGGEAARTLLNAKAADDPNPRVREFARQAVDANASWFKI